MAQDSLKAMIALAFAVSTIATVSANTPVTLRLSEPVSVAGVPSVTLGPGTYVLRQLDSSAGVNVVQVLSKRQDYVYTTVLTIPASRLHPGDKHQVFFSESPSGNPPVLQFWFPAGETSGHEFINPRNLLTPERSTGSKELQVRVDGTQNRGTGSVQNTADFYALREVLLRMENGKFAAARDLFRRNYFLSQNSEGAAASFLLALLMLDSQEARESLDIVRRIDRERSRVLSQLDADGVVASLPRARPNLKASPVRRFLLNFAMEMIDDTIARTAIVSFERHVLKGDSFPVEIVLDRRREELAKEKRRDEQWILANEQIANLSDCVKSLLNKVGALEYSASVEAKVGLFGSVRLRVVLNQRKLDDLDAIVELSHRTLCQRQPKLERLISQRNAAVARELDALRLALRDLDRQPGSVTSSQFTFLRHWEAAPASGVSRDLIILAEAANSPFMKPSVVFRTDRGFVQINIAASLARLAEWAGL